VKTGSGRTASITQLVRETLCHPFRCCEILLDSRCREMLPLYSRQSGQKFDVVSIFTCYVNMSLPLPFFLFIKTDQKTSGFHLILERYLKLCKASIEIGVNKNFVSLAYADGTGKNWFV
jgi:hypothetical protein